MSRDIEADRLTTFEVAPDGSRVRIRATDAAGGAASISLPAECLSQMMMTLPRIALEAVRRRHRNQALKVVYPAAKWDIEQSGECPDTFILTLTTPDGFEVSFALSGAKLDGLAKAADRATEQSAAPSLALN